MKHDVVMTIGAHNDDYIIGAGGTLAKYALEGKRVINVVFSYGEMSHPWIKSDVTRKTRYDESLIANKLLLNNYKIIYLGLNEGKFASEFEKKKERLKRMIKVHKPTKIFTHSVNDPHQDHQAVLKIVMKLLDEIKYKGSVFSFDVWNPINVRARNSPKLVVDIGDTFKKKIDSFKLHKSQKITILIHLWGLYLKAFYNGISYGYKYAELFYKIK